MRSAKKLVLKTSTLVVPLLIVLVIWAVLWSELTFHFSVSDWGIRPRTLIGLRGIVFGPFIHGGVMHALSNTLPMLFLMVALFYFYEGIAWKVLIYGTLLTGFLTWLIARGGATHIGASGVVYLMFSFLFFKGIWSKNYRLIALSLVIVFIYGGLIWGMVPMDPKISWEGHLSGFVSGILFSLLFIKYDIETHYVEPTPTVISPQEAEFLSHFDEDGNFVPASERTQTEEGDNSLNIRVEYCFKPTERETKDR